MSTKKIKFKVNTDKFEDFIEKLDDLTKISPTLKIKIDNNDILIYSVLGKAAVLAFKNYMFKTKELFILNDDIENTFDIVIIEGKKFVKNLQLRNAEAWLKDAEQEAKEIVEAIRSKLAFANSDGTVEEWAGGIDADELAERIEKEFATFKENFINKLKDDNRVEIADSTGDSESN